MVTSALIPAPKTYLGWAVDYTAPPGEPGFAAPGSVSWRVFKNPVALAIGGVAAVLLEFADPRIRSGVWDHSTFRTDPVGRSARTGIAAMVGVFGPQSAARRIIRGVTHMHANVAGVTPGGERYHALDAELLDWVSATAAYGFVTAYDRFAAPLGDDAQAGFFTEGQAVARLYGATSPIGSHQDFNAMLDRLLPRFEPHDINTQFLSIMASGRAAPAVPRGLHSALVNAAVDILPGEVRERLELGRAFDLTPRGRSTVKAMARIADRVPDLKSPAAQASARLGLPRSFPWRSGRTQARWLARAGWTGKTVAAP